MALASGWFRLLAILGTVTACKRDRPIPSTPAAGSASRATTPGAAAEIRVRLPDRWEGRYELDTLSTRERGNARPGARAYTYRPKDQSIRPQALAVVAVYDTAAWAAVRAEGGPPPGDSVGERAGLVYVVGLPQSNPFRPGTADAVSFDSLQLSADEAAHFVILDR